MSTSELRSDKTQNTYELMAKAIVFMREHYRSQPDLGTIAAHVHLSEYHFQRLFTKWAGISPKRFSQYLTLEYAKAKLSETKSLLDLTTEVGLSSPGRLHDLFVNIEAMSPGEFKAAGAGLTIGYGIHETPFGLCLMATTARGLCTLQFLETVSPAMAEERLHQLWPHAVMVWEPNRTQVIADQLFSPQTISAHPVPLHVKGTNFQLQVWRALLRIPFGQLISYQDLATLMGQPASARAVGNAVGKNPIGYLIPCHRVIRTSGDLGGYRWGLPRKSVLLGWEASRGEGLEG